MSDLTTKIVITAKDLTQGAIDGVKKGLRGLGVSSEKASKSTDKLGDESQETANQQKNQKASTDALNNSTKSYNNTLASTTKRILAFGGAYLGLNKLKEGLLSILSTGGRFETLQVQLKAVMGTVEGGETAFAWIKEFTKSTPLQLEGVTNAFVKMKAYGLDPMDGTMQKLADISSKLGGGQERLEGIILAVGQAWTKGKLQAEEANQLIERGVPVWDLMAKALGKTTAEMQSMASNGELTRKEIKLLIDEIGKSSEGAAAAQMNTWAGIISNLGDTWTTFLNTIAESGALDYFKEQLASLLKTTQEMAADGSLKRWAQDISLIFTRTAEVIGGLTDIVRIAFNSLQVVAGALVKTFVDMAASINESLAAITFGDTSAEFKSNAEELRSYSEVLKDGVDEDVKQIKESYESLITPFSDVSEAAKKSAADVVKAADEKKAAAEKERQALEDNVNAYIDSEQEKRKNIEETGEANQQVSAEWIAANEEIIASNEKTAESAKAVAEATGILKLELAEITGEATVAGKEATQAFLDIANGAGLTAEEIAKVADKTLDFAKTKGDLDLMVSAFDEIGVSASKHPEIVKEITDTIIEMGGSLDDIPTKWRDIADQAKGATKEIEGAKKATDNFNESAAKTPDKTQNQQAQAQTQEPSSSGANQSAPTGGSSQNEVVEAIKTQSLDFSSDVSAMFSGLTEQNRRLLDSMIAANTLRSVMYRSQEANSSDLIRHLYNIQQQREASASKPDLQTFVSAIHKAGLTSR